MSSSGCVSWIPINQSSKINSLEGFHHKYAGNNFFKQSIKILLYLSNIKMALDMHYWIAGCFLLKICYLWFCAWQVKSMPLVCRKAPACSLVRPHWNDGKRRGLGLGWGLRARLVSLVFADVTHGISRAGPLVLKRGKHRASNCSLLG